MYTIRSFIRMNGVSKQDVDEFVKSVAGKGLSIRDNRFKMKCFFHEALTFWNYAADICIIDLL